MSDDTRERQQQRERRVQTVLLSIATSAILWALYAVLQASMDLAAIKPRIADMSVQLSTMYRADDARRDVAEMLGRITANERRIDDVEQRVRKIESRGGGK